MSGLKGWTLPQTPSGLSATLTPPPWHYSGDIIAVDYKADPANVAPLMPPGMEPLGDGSVTLFFADWCSASDADPRVLADPAKGQYHEAYWVLYGTYEGKPAGRVPFIYVDSELSLIRGLVQGFPKKLGRIAMTRPVEIGHGGVRREPGNRFAAHVTAGDRRLATISVELEAETTRGPGPQPAPLLHTRLWPSLDSSKPGVEEFLRVTAYGFEQGRILSGTATLEVGTSEHDEVALLAPVTVGRGYSYPMAFSVSGGVATPIETRQEATV